MNDDESCWYCCCYQRQQHCQSSAARYWSIQLLYILLLVIITSTFYLYWSDVFNNSLHLNTTRSEPAVVLAVASVVHTTQHSTLATSTLLCTTSSTAAVSNVTSTSQSASTTIDTPHVEQRKATANQSSEKGANRSLCDHYVSFPSDFPVRHGLGNQMFDLAAVVYVAELTGRQPAILKANYQMAFDEVFDLRIKRFDNPCPCYLFVENATRSLAYDRRVEELANDARAEEARGRSIFLYGYFQSWKYTLNVERQLRRHFTFLPEIGQFVDKFLADSRPPGWSAGYLRVAIHVRRGDVLSDNNVKFGRTTPDERYFAHAMRYFVDRFDRVQFIVASNDITWCRQKLSNVTMALRHRVKVTLLSSLSASKDFAVLASCEHVIISTGTYGWWAAWLARGITIYYADWPRKGSDLAKKFTREDFFPPNWIGMT